MVASRSLCSRFSLTLWQGTEDPSVSDLLFVRDNMHPQRVYYDLSQPVLSHFREAAGERPTGGLGALHAAKPFC